MVVVGAEVVVVVVSPGAKVVVVVVVGARVVVVVVRPGAKVVVVVVRPGAKVVVVVVSPVGPDIFPTQVVGATVKLYVSGGGGGPGGPTKPASVTNPQVLASFEVDGYLADILVVDPAVASSPLGDSCHVV